MTDITSANAILIIGSANIFPNAQQLQGFAADDIFDVDAIASAQTSMGVDGLLSAGFVFEQLKQTITLQADSPSGYVFDNIYAYERQTVSKQVITATFKFTSIGVQFIINKGFMTSYTPMAAGKRILQPRRFSLEWEAPIPGPIIGV